MFLHFPLHRRHLDSSLLLQDALFPFYECDLVKLIILALSDMDGATGVAIIPRAKLGLVGVALKYAHGTRVIFVKLEDLTPLFTSSIAIRLLVRVLDAVPLLLIIPPTAMAAAKCSTCSGVNDAMHCTSMY